MLSLADALQQLAALADEPSPWPLGTWSEVWDVQLREAHEMLGYMYEEPGFDLRYMQPACNGARLFWRDGALVFQPRKKATVERREAVCFLLADALRRYWRAQGLDPVKTARKTFGNALARRWFVRIG